MAGLRWTAEVGRGWAVGFEGGRGRGPTLEAGLPEDGIFPMVEAQLWEAAGPRVAVVLGRPVSGGLNHTPRQTWV